MTLLPLHVFFGQISPAAAAAVKEAAESPKAGAPAPAATQSVEQLLADLLSRHMPALVGAILARLILVAAVIVVGWLTLKIIGFLIRRVGIKVLVARAGPGSRARSETLVNLFYSMVKYIIIFFTFILAVRQAGLNPTPFLGGAAIIGLAVSFGSQGLVQDVVTGIFVMLEDQFNVGEYVDLGGKSGIVTGMSIRIVTIRDAQGNLQNIPYRTISVITNSSRTSAPLVMDVFLASEKEEADAPAVLDKALTLLNEELSPLVRSHEVVGVINAGTDFRAVRANIVCMPGRTDFVQAEALDRVKKAFTAAGLEIPGDKVRFFGRPLENDGVFHPAI
jgi:small conductance mechanosensitive channel